METELKNTVSATGNINEIPTLINSVASVVTMLSGLTITKEADKTIWADGLLTYTITIANQTTLPYVSPVVTDILDTSLIEFVTDSVMIDGVKATADEAKYDAGTGTLAVNLSDIEAAGTKTITFQVTKKA